MTAATAIGGSPEDAEPGPGLDGVPPRAGTSLNFSWPEGASFTW